MRPPPSIRDGDENVVLICEEETHSKAVTRVKLHKNNNNNKKNKKPTIICKKNEMDDIYMLVNNAPCPQLAISFILLRRLVDQVVW